MDRDEYLELADWRRSVAGMFEAWREASASDPERATAAFRAAKDRLFAEHPQSPLMPEDRPGFTGIPYWPYNAAWRMTGRLERSADSVGPHSDALEEGVAPPPAAARPLGFATAPIALPNSGSGAIPFRRIGRVELQGPLAGHSLAVFWIDAYGGGLFLPFRDTTSGMDTYGAGRYLLDTIKSADHGGDYRSGTVLLDFNLAFHPSCAYDPRWSCPLAPIENHLPVPVFVGERLGAGPGAGGH